MTNINNVLKKLKSMSILSFDEGEIKKSKRKTIVKRGVEFKKNITIPRKVMDLVMKKEKKFKKNSTKFTQVS